MRRVTLRALWIHRRRLVSTVIAIVLGVGFMAGTLVLSTTLDQVADDLFRARASEIDALVQGEAFVGGAGASGREPLPVGTVQRVRRVDGVAAAAAHVSARGTGATNRLLSKRGFPLGTELGPGTVFENWIEDPALTPYRIAEGRAPEADDEIVVNVKALEDGDAGVGDALVVLGQFGMEPYTVVGAFTSGTATSAGGAISVEFTLAEAQRLTGTEGRVHGVYVVAEDGVTEADLVGRLEGELQAVDVISGERAEADLTRGGGSDLRFLQVILVVFGVVALLVGGFVIANTFTILVAQRTRDLALLRALGASRSQVFGSVLAEAAVVGLVASAVGVVVGLRLAVLINRGLDEIGAELPTSSLVVRPSTIALSFAMGVTITLVAAVLPAVRATRVRPLAAIRDVDVDRSHASGPRALAGAALLAAGAFACSAAWTANGDAAAIPRVGAGAVLVIVGTVVGGPLFAGRTVRIPGRGIRRIRGVTGRLATENAARNPQRTSASASAVLVSVALLVFVTAFAASSLESVEADARRGFAGDLIVTGPGGLTLPNGLLSSPIPAFVRDAVADVEGVDLVAGMGFEPARLTYPDGETESHHIASVDEQGLGTILRPRMVEGAATDLREGGIVVDRLVAAEHDLSVGDEVVYELQGARPLDLEIQGVSDDPNVLGYATVTRSTYSSVAPQVRDVQVGAIIEPGADLDSVLAAVRAELIRVPRVWAYEREAFIEDLKEQIGSFVNVIYGLLALSVLISVLGIGNTLSLTIHERTREIGLLRAVGMDRSGVRSAVRWEAALIASFGVLAGLAVGTPVSAAVILSLRELGLVTFDLPLGAVVAIAIGALIFGVVAAIRPAQRASRASILDAIATE